MVQNFEKLGAFYLGKRFDTEADRLTEELVLYDAKDLTTHAVIIGMTGSGLPGCHIRRTRPAVSGPPGSCLSHRDTPLHRPFRRPHYPTGIHCHT